MAEIVKIFQRISKKTNKPFFTMSLVTDDGYEDMGFIALSRSTGARAAFEQIEAEGLLKEGSTAKGNYKMLTAVVDMESDIAVVKGMTVIKDFTPIL